MTFTPSPHQQALLDWTETGNGNARVDACAGSGKTTTCEQMIFRIPTDQSVRYLVFNKKNAVEAEERITRANTEVSTFHSCSFRAWKAFAGRRVKVDSSKLRWIVKDEFSETDRFVYGLFAQRLAAKAKIVGINVILEDTFENWEEIAFRYDIALENVDGDWVTGIGLARELLEASNKDLSRVDFDDMLYLPALYNCQLENPDWLFVDEAQDCSAVQIELLKRMVGPDTRFVAVGDPYQAIYGFRGAESDSMDHIADAFQCQHFPLSVSFRCPREVVALAAEYAVIEPHENAPAGEIIYANLAEDGKYVFDNSDETGTFEPSDAILCRNTAPLVSTAYTLIRNGHGCKVLGRDIGAGLVSLIKKMEAATIDGLYKSLGDFLARESAKFRKSEREDKVESLNDKVGSIFAVMDNCPKAETPEDIIAEIESLFKEEKDGSGLITLATVHKAKGLEWDTVFILNRFDLMPSRFASQPWQMEQENNLIYVAYTRAKDTLVFLSSLKQRDRGTDDYYATDL